MSPTTPETEHPAWPAPGEHLWGQWMVQDRNHHHRSCLHPDCKQTQVKEAPRG